MNLHNLKKNEFLVYGRAGMDIYADPPGTSVETANGFYASLGGSAGNIAVGIVKLGGRSSLVSAVSDDAVGRFVTNALESYGVENDFVTCIPGECRTSLAVTETRIEKNQNVIYRNNAADFQVTSEQIAQIDFSEFGALILTGTGLAAEPSRTAAFEATQLAREKGLAVILDIDYRPYSWTSREVASEIYKKAADECDFILGNDEEFSVIAGSIEKGFGFAKDHANSKGCVVIYKKGEMGSVTFDGANGHFETGIFPVEALKPMGSGDAFMAAFVTSLATGESLAESVRVGSAAAAIVVSSIGCAPAMPNLKELTNFANSANMKCVN